MKIISGKLKGRVLKGYDLEKTRPTMERVKESTFAMIQNKLPSSIVLDLFSGSGNLGIEAISQGASKVYLVDKEKAAVRVIEENVSKCHIEEETEIFLLDYIKALAYFHHANIQFDIVFIDPPYKSDYAAKSVSLLDELNLLQENATIVVETSSSNFTTDKSSYTLEKSKKYGDKFVYIYSYHKEL